MKEKLILSVITLLSFNISGCATSSAPNTLLKAEAIAGKAPLNTTNISPKLTTHDNPGSVSPKPDTKPSSSIVDVKVNTETPVASTRDKPRISIPKLDVTPLTSYHNKDVTPSKVSFNDTYTRILIRSDIYEKDASKSTSGSENGNASESLPMKYQSRPWYKRLAIADTYDINLTAKLKVDGYEETVPLATLSQSSGKNGETWLRDINHELSSYPWFLVKKGGSSSSPRFTVEFKGSRNIESGAAGYALQIALGAIKMVAPETNIITTLSSSSAKDKSNAIDQAVGKLFSNNLTERHTSDRDFTKWSPEGGFNIVVSLPEQNNDWNGTLATIGGWTINFDAPHPSIFSDWYICDKEPAPALCKNSFEKAVTQVFKEKNDASILAYQLVKTSAGSISIKEHLLKQQWFANAISSFTGNADNDKWIANGLCLGIADEIHALGLNSVDANLVVLAVITSMQRPKAMEAMAWKNAQACMDSKQYFTNLASLASPKQ
ncbi:MAG: hypothetical protein V4525_08250 [Pseudomonadota bacterium]